MDKEKEVVFEMPEIQTKPEIPPVEVVRISDGLGFGEGSISYQDRKATVGEALMGQVENKVSQGQILVPVDRAANGQPLDDDGCGDGRKFARIIQKVFEKGAEKVKEFSRSLHRAKVFGGAPAMTTAAHIGLGDVDGRSLRKLFHRSLVHLDDEEIDYGGHTNEHAHGPNCGCGAIDKAPAVIGNIAKYATQITATISGLGVDRQGLPAVMNNFIGYGKVMDASDYTGRAVMDDILDRSKVVKQLTDEHKEALIILNTVEGYTVDQEQIRSLSEGEVQVFVVDVWRLQDLAKRLYPDQGPETQNQAFLSQLVYTLGVAATLTKGDLPVYMVNQQTQPAAA